MSETKRYNGWNSYETWNVALWLDNDEGSYRHSRSLAQDAWDNAEASQHFTREEQAALDLSEMLKEMVEEQNPLASDASMFSDLLSAALSEVDWQEIATHYLDDVDKEDEDEESEDEDAPGFIEVEYDLNYSGGDYSGQGEIIRIPESLIADNEDDDEFEASVKAAFQRITGHDPIHIIHFSNEIMHDDETPE